MKVLVTNYTFNAATRAITFTDYAGPGITLERIFVVSNVTDGLLIFNFADAGVTGTVATNVLTLAYDTTSMSNTDKLCIIYDDPAVTTQAVSGTVTANAGTNLNTSALATSAKQDTLLTELQLKADLTETQPVSLASVPTHAVTGPLTDVELRATPVPVSGTVTASGPLTDTQLRATPVPVSGTVTANAGTGTFTVSGTVTANAGTGPFPVSDNAGSLTVDAPVATPVATRLSDGAAFLTTTGGRLAVDASGVAVPVTDNGGSLTVDYATTGSGTATGAVRVELPTNGTGVIATVGAVTAITNALPTGANAIGKLAENSGVDIGDVDVTTVGTITPGTAATSLGKAVDNVAGATDTGVAVLAIRDDALTTLTPIDGDYVPLRVDSTGKLHVTTAGGGAGTEFAEDTVHSSGALGTFSLCVANEANTTLAGDGDYIASATDTEGNTRIVGNRDHDAVDAGEVVGVGMRAIAHGTNPTAVAAADRTAWYANRAGVPFVIGGHPNTVTLRANYTAANTDAAIVTVAGGLKIVVTRCSVMCHKANTVNVAVVIGFGATTTPTTTGVVLAHPGIAPGGGVVEGVGAGILGTGADGEDLRITSGVPTTGSIDVVVSYYTIES